METLPFHIGITTDNLAGSMRDLGDALGMSWTPPSGGEYTMYAVDGSPQLRPISCMSREDGIRVDLIEGRAGTIWATSGPRLHHFAYWTDDLRGDTERLVREGWRLEMTRVDDQGSPSSDPRQFAYLVRADGMRIELVDDAGRDEYAARTRA